MIVFNKEEVIEALLETISTHNIKGDILISSQPKDRYVSKGYLMPIASRHNSYCFLADIIHANPIFTFHITEEMYSNLNLFNDAIDDILYHMPQYDGSEIFIGSVEENKPYIAYDGEFYFWSMLHGYLNDCEDSITIDTLYQDFIDHNGENDYEFDESLIRKLSTPEGLAEYLNTPAGNLPASQAILTYFKCYPTGISIKGVEDFKMSAKIQGFI